MVKRVKLTAEQRRISRQAASIEHEFFFRRTSPALDLRGNVALEGCSEAVAKALLDTRKSRKPAVEELWFPINDQQEGSGAVDLVQQLEYAEVMGHDEL